jgi:hypothetical protein
LICKAYKSVYLNGCFLCDWFVLCNPFLNLGFIMKKSVLLAALIAAFALAACGKKEEAAMPVEAPAAVAPATAAETAPAAAPAEAAPATAEAAPAAPAAAEAPKQ